MAKKRLSDLLRDEAKSLNPKPTNTVNQDETGDVWAEPQPADSSSDPKPQSEDPVSEPANVTEQSESSESAPAAQPTVVPERSPEAMPDLAASGEAGSDKPGDGVDLEATQESSTEPPIASPQATSSEAIAPAATQENSTPSAKPSSKRLTKAGLEKKVAQLEAALQTAQDYEARLEQDLAQMRSQVQQQETTVQRLSKELAEAKELILKLSATPATPMSTPAKSASQSSLVPVRTATTPAPPRGNVPSRPIQPGGLPPMSTETLAIAKPPSRAAAQNALPAKATTATPLNLQRVPQSGSQSESQGGSQSGSQGGSQGGSQSDRRPPALPLMPSEKLPPAPRPSAMSGPVLPGGLPRMSTEDWLPPMSTQDPANDPIPEMAAETVSTKPGSRLTNKELGWVD